MNILLLSCGTRNKIIEYFKKTIQEGDKIIATDCSELAPALYIADKHYIVPKITEPEYINTIIKICKKEKIDGVLSLIDPELSLLAQHKNEFVDIGTMVIGSSYELCEISLNKMKMFQWLSNKGYNCARSYIDKIDFYNDLSNGEMFFPVFVKPICGSASMAISKVEDKETIDLLFNRNSNLMIQEFLDGQEIGADVYIDMITGEVISIFTKKKIAMRAGETDKAVSFKDNTLFEFIEKFVIEMGYRGQIDIDIFEINGEYYISEVNPRFGGGYPHAYECGANHMKYICNNLKGLSNTPEIGEYENDVFMMKYNEVLIKKIEG